MIFFSCWKPDTSAYGSDMRTGSILITGGARSGKSAYAESLLRNERQVVYIATAQIADAEMRERIRRHQEVRPESWTTVEQTYDLHTVCAQMPDSLCFLLDCLSILTSNIMFDLTQEHGTISMDLQETVEHTVIQEIERLLEAVKARQGLLAMVTNEVGWSIVPEHHVARVYRDILGRVNQRVAALCDEVYLVACGIPLRLK